MTNPLSALGPPTWAIAVTTPDGHTAILSKRYPLSTEAHTTAQALTRQTLGFEFKAIQTY